MVLIVTPLVLAAPTYDSSAGDGDSWHFGWPHADGPEDANNQNDST